MKRLSAWVGVTVDGITMQYVSLRGDMRRERLRWELQ
jgi:hypothetical protein